MENQNSEIQYFVAANGPFLVISFVGLWDKEGVEKIKDCEESIKAHKNIKFVILYFREVPNITLDAVSFLTSLQKKIRDNHVLRVCSLKPDLRQKLSKMGVVRGTELTDNLQATLLDLKNME